MDLLRYGPLVSSAVAGAAMSAARAGAQSGVRQASVFDGADLDTGARRHGEGDENKRDNLAHHATLGVMNIKMGTSMRCENHAARSIAGM
jgi:hypothetical protein